jgi:hypothetical protein
LQTLPARLTGNRLTSTLPTSLSVGFGYAVRVLSAVGSEQFYSAVSVGNGFRVYRVPRLQLTPPDNQTLIQLEPTQNSVDVQLLDPGLGNALTSLSRPYRYRINEQFYSSVDQLPRTVPLFANSARPTAYSITAVYDAYCGFGSSAGSVRVSYKPGVRSLALNKTQFCRNGDQAVVAYEISGDFDATARFTVFLTNAAGTRTQVAQSANAIDRLTFPISPSLAVGTYQVSLVSSVTGIPGLDNLPSITIGDVPNVALTGGYAIQYANTPVTVGVRVLGGYLPVSLTFTNGEIKTLSTTESTFALLAQPNVTYRIAQAGNSCGLGTSSGTVSVTVLPNGPNELRVASIGPAPGAQGICQGGTVTVGLDLTGTFGANNTYTVYLSDSTGANYRPLPTRLVSANTLSATLPANAVGTGFRLRIGASNPAVLGASSSLLTIKGPQTATIGGPTQANVGELVPIVITLNNTGPWSLTLNNSVYGLETFTINQSPFTYRVRLDGTTTYTLLGVSGLECGRGTPSGSLTVRIVNVLAVDPNLPVAAMVAPNPTPGLVRVVGTLPALGRTTLRLTDTQGRTLLLHDLGLVSTLNHALDLSGYAAGTYLLSVESEAARTVFKVVRE